MSCRCGGERLHALPAGRIQEEVEPPRPGAGVKTGTRSLLPPVSLGASEVFLWGCMNFVLTTVLILTTIAAPARAESLQSLTGTPDVRDGRTMIVAGKSIVLADIATPALGTKCLWRKKPLDCGVLARAGLKDITAGGRVACKKIKGGHRCTGDGYDLAYGLIHAGWAVPKPGAPAIYLKKMQEAEGRKRGLWNATFPDGTTSVARSLKR